MENETMVQNEVAPEVLPQTTEAVAAVAAVEVAPEAPPTVEAGVVPHPHAELGIRTKPGSDPFEIDDVLLANVGTPMDPKEISEASKVDLKRTRIHLAYWQGFHSDGVTPMKVGENGWTQKRIDSGLHQRLKKTEDGKYFLAPKE